jgi:hypothetical protein
MSIKKRNVDEQVSDCCLTPKWAIFRYIMQGLWDGSLAGTSVRDPWISVGPHSLTQTHFIFLFFFSHFFVIIFNSNPKFGEESQPVPRASKQSCSTLQNFSWSPWYHGKNKSYFYEMMSALYWTNPLNWIFIVLAHSSQVDMSLHYDTGR